jgi:hypothetical protein
MYSLGACSAVPGFEDSVVVVLHKLLNLQLSERMMKVETTKFEVNKIAEFLLIAMSVYSSNKVLVPAMRVLTNLSDFTECYTFMTHSNFKDIFNCYFLSNEFEVASNGVWVIYKLLKRVASQDYP